MGSRLFYGESAARVPEISSDLAACPVSGFFVRCDALTRGWTIFSETPVSAAAMALSAGVDLAPVNGGVSAVFARRKACGPSQPRPAGNLR